VQKPTKLFLILAAASAAAIGCAETPSSRGPEVGAAIDGSPTPFNNTGGAAGGGAPVAASNNLAGSTTPAGTTGTTGATNTSGVPCDVQAVIASNCQQCHGAAPVGGAISLVTLEDWHQASPFYAGLKGMPATTPVYEVAQIRINNGEMPQGKTMAPADLSTLDSWLLGGAQQAPAQDPTCATGTIGDTTTPTTSTAMTPTVTDPPVLESGVIDNCTLPGAYDTPVAAPGEVCHAFDVHAPNSTGAFTVPTGESYHEFYYAVPWAPGDVWTHYGADFDNLQVLHHYLVFTSSAGKRDRDVVQNVLGTTLGTSATLIGGWAVGGCNTEMPDDVGGQLPPSPLIMIQWHLYNNTGRSAQDNSKVLMCTVPAGSRTHTAGITFLGTENFFGPVGMPVGHNDFTTQCTNNSGAPITVIGFNPHMHLLGSNMKTDLRSGGSTRTIFDMPFQFDYQVGYEIPPTVVAPGDTLITTCSFENDTGSNVAFGESTNTEMCYQFALSYPAGALNNGALSLIGALNTCW